MSLDIESWHTYLKYDKQEERSVITWSLLGRVWQFARPYYRRVLGLLLTILLTSTISLIQPMLFRDLIDNAIPQADITRLNWLALGMISIPLVNGVVGLWQQHLKANIGEGIIYDLRRALYLHIQQMSLRFFTQMRTGELLSRLNNDVVGAQQAIGETLVTIISNIVTIVVTLVIMLFFEWRLTLLAMVIFPLFMITARYVERALRTLSRKSLAYQAEMNVTIHETLNVSGALLVKLFGREAQELGRFSKDADAVRKIEVQSAVVGSWLFGILGVVSVIGTVVVYWVGGHLVLRQEFTVGTIVAFSVYLTQLYGPLMTLTNAPIEFAQSMVSFERVFEVLDMPMEITTSPSAPALPPVKGQIRFENVSFSYTDDSPVFSQETALSTSEASSKVRLRWHQQRNSVNGNGTKSKSKQALLDVSFTIEPGQLVALVGPSGAGKTTITYLIPRLYDPTNGRIFIDQTDIKSVTLASLTNNIGMVTQESFLFYDTIRANLLYARPNATEAQIMTATKAANIHDVIMGLPNGYDTYVGERGYRLSGGERQRLAIARVILKDPRILVLDEATSSLDSLSEALVQEALQRVMKNRTSLVIAHRLSTILAADVILVLDQGRLVEQGTHQELLAQGKLYTTLYQTQFKPLAEPFEG